MPGEYGRYGYRRITAMLQMEGWTVNHKRVERIWRQEGLKVPGKQPKRARLWLNDGSCVRLRPEHPDHVWAYDFVHARTHEGRAVRMLTVVDEFTRECLAIDVARKLNSENVLARLASLMTYRGVPRYIRSDNGPEFTADAVRDWLKKIGVNTLFEAKVMAEDFRELYNEKRPHEAWGRRPPAPMARLLRAAGSATLRLPRHPGDAETTR